MTLTILADDLTGACDTGSLFAGKGSVPVSIWPARPPGAPVRVLDTETRTTTASAARERVRSAARAAPAPAYFKKIDSTLRGRIGAEVEALLEATGAPSALLAPAFPSQRRAVVDRVLLVDGRPVADTAIARDPDFPALPAGSSSSVVALIRPQLQRPLAWIPLAQVRAGSMPLAARLQRLAGMIVVADAETDEDLEALVDGAFEVEPAPLLVGSAGLGRALARRLGVLVEHVGLPAGCRWLVVVGSLHPASREQAERARGAGLSVVASAGERRANPTDVARGLAEDAARRLAADRFDLVAVTGGETALALCRALGADTIELAGPPMPGLALGRLPSRLGRDLWIVTKAGGFGPPDLFVSLAERAAT
ncbi:MAG: four-carbon acid sugar kinase family protein [Candidatus Rokubacteria bacterium]|nr:four-carbon acid sugar kinase family protein [Candidatus Rokubacteria bacterium]